MSRILKNLKTLAIYMAILLPFTLTACGKTLDWSQEALLHDGRTLWVERHSERGSPSPGNSGLEIGQTLAFRHPDTGARIEWRITKGLQPVMLDFDHGVPYYVLEPYVSSDFYKWGCPNPPYLVYRYQQDKWTHIAFVALPVSFVKRNLMEMSKVARGLVDGGRVSAEKMEAFWEDAKISRGKESRLISREKIDPRPFTARCSVDVLIAQGRESEMDEEERSRLSKFESGMTVERRRDFEKHINQLKKELQERLQ